MKKIYSVLILVLTLCGASFAQGSKQTGEIQAGTSIQGQLEQNLDVRNSKVGDRVVLKVSRAIRQNGETLVPKGANLIGRITEVQQTSKNNAGSRLGVIFERLQGKNLDAPISASIAAILQTAGNARAGDEDDPGIPGNSNQSSEVSRRRSDKNSGGGLLGGVGNTVGGVTGAAGETVNGAADTAGQTLGGATLTVGRAVSGIRISQSADASANGSTTLSANDKNLKLEKGVTFNLLLNTSARVN